MNDPCHPSSEELARFAGKDLSPYDTAKMESHLKLCLNCRWKLDEMLSRATGALLGWQGSELAYDRAIERSVENVTGPLARVIREVDEAPLILADLLRQPEGERRRLIREEEQFRAVKLCQLLQERSREAWHNDAKAALELSELAVAVADRLDPSRYSPSMVQDAQAMAWAYLGNSYRVASDFLEAENAFRIALLRHRQSGEDALTEGEILSLMTSLRLNQGFHEEALAFLDRSIALFCEVEDLHLESRALVKKSLLLIEAGRPSDAADVAQRILRRIDIKESPQIFKAALQNLALALVEGGAASQANQIIRQLCLLGQDSQGSLDMLRRTWLQGRVFLELHDLKKAESSLSEVRSAYLERGLLLGAATVGLDLGIVFAKQGRPGAVRRVAREVIPVFQSYRKSRQVSAAHLLYKQNSG